MQNFLQTEYESYVNKRFNLKGVSHCEIQIYYTASKTDGGFT